MLMYGSYVGVFFSIILLFTGKIGVQKTQEDEDLDGECSCGVNSEAEGVKICFNTEKLS